MSMQPDEQCRPDEQAGGYEPPEVISFRRDELLPEAQAQFCQVSSPTCITVDCTPRF